MFLCLNIFKIFYCMMESLIDAFGAYNERTGKYLACFRRDIDNASVILDIGCGSGIFSRALANKKRLVIALDIQKQSLREFLLPKKLQSLIFRKLNYAYVNMNVSIKYALSLLNKAGFILRKTIKVYHIGIMRLLPIAPSYIFILEKC
ncbi:MAG: class I SAM-dependent methyltransferase [Candidatus Bathyarchaeia archaeon]